MGFYFLIDDLRGNGPVYYVFKIDEYYRLDKNFNVILKETYTWDPKKNQKEGKLQNIKRIFELKEGKLKFQWRISVLDKVVDIKSKFYKYKGFKRYHIKVPTKQQIKMVKLKL